MFQRFYLFRNRLPGYRSAGFVYTLQQQLQDFLLLSAPQVFLLAYNDMVKHPCRNLRTLPDIFISAVAHTGNNTNLTAGINILHKLFNATIPCRVMCKIDQDLEAFKFKNIHTARSLCRTWYKGLQ
ncbi:hypothetical protein D9M68_855720 [compost metagenome]